MRMTIGLCTETWATTGYHIPEESPSPHGAHMDPPNGVLNWLDLVKGLCRQRSSGAHGYYNPTRS